MTSFSRIQTGLFVEKPQGLLSAIWGGWQSATLHAQQGATGSSERRYQTQTSPSIRAMRNQSHPARPSTPPPWKTKILLMKRSMRIHVFSASKFLFIINEVLQSELSGSRGRSPCQPCYRPLWGGWRIWEAVKHSSTQVTRGDGVWPPAPTREWDQIRGSQGGARSSESKHQTTITLTWIPARLYQCHTRCYERKYMFLEGQKIHITDWLGCKRTNLSELEKTCIKWNKNESDLIILTKPV